MYDIKYKILITVPNNLIICRYTYIYILIV